MGHVAGVAVTEQYGGGGVFVRNKPGRDRLTVSRRQRQILVGKPDVVRRQSIILGRKVDQIRLEEKHGDTHRHVRPGGDEHQAIHPPRPSASAGFGFPTGISFRDGIAFSAGIGFSLRIRLAVLRWAEHRSITSHNETTHRVAWANSFARGTPHDPRASYRLPMPPGRVFTHAELGFPPLHGRLSSSVGPPIVR